MKKIIKLIILCVFLAQYSGIRAQGSNISVESIIGFPAQAYYYQQYNTFSIFLSNNDSVAYQGYISIVFRTDSMNTNTDSASFGGPYLVNIPANSFDTLPIGGFFFDTASFKLGGNVVVVWPVSSGGTQIMFTDTFYTYVEILGYAGITDLEQSDQNNNIYPVPANDKLFLPENINKNDLEHVRIIDMLGRQKYFSGKAELSINSSFLEQGVYFIEIKEKNKTPRVFKFIISR